jgi:aminoglycoside phosphotransferase (APT) family kinase protein
MAIEAAIKAGVARWFQGATDIDGLAQLSGGASQETWSFSVQHPEGDIAVILRRAPSGYGAAPGRAAGLEAEAVLMQQAFEAGIPSPRVRHVLQPEDGLGSGFVMDRVEGETIPARFCATRSLLRRARCWRASSARWSQVFTRWIKQACRSCD